MLMYLNIDTLKYILMHFYFRTVQFARVNGYILGPQHYMPSAPQGQIPKIQEVHFFVASVCCYKETLKPFLLLSNKMLNE